MNQDQQIRRWWKVAKDNWTVLALAALILAIATITILGYWQRWSWTGLETKSAWDWLDLLIVPVVLGAAALWFNVQQSRKAELERAERELRREVFIAEDRVREEALQRYLDNMQELILDKNLPQSDEGSLARIVANARTLTVLRSLDGDRTALVLRFLHEAGLIGTLWEGQVIDAVIDLGDTDLSHAILSHAILSYADLSHVNLGYAYLIGTNLSGAHLSGANLIGAVLSGANLSHANLFGANGWTNEQLARAGSLVGATMPDGTVMTEEAWEEFKKRYRQ